MRSLTTRFAFRRSSPESNFSQSPGILLAFEASGIGHEIKSLRLWNAVADDYPPPRRSIDPFNAVPREAYAENY